MLGFDARPTVRDFKRLLQVALRFFSANENAALRSQISAAASGLIGSSGLTMNTARVLMRTAGGVGAVQEGDAATLAAFVQAQLPIPLRGAIDGLVMSTAGASTTMTIGAGMAADSTSSVLMSLASPINKTTSSWAVGSGNGGLDTGTIANSTWYYFFQIRRPDTGVVDVVFSTNSSSPTLPTNYTQYRYIGAGLTNGSGQWTLFRQVGDYFVWNSPVLDIDASTTTTAALSTLSVPRGRKILARFNIYGSDGTSGQTGIYISDPDTSDDAPSTSAAPLATLGGNGAATEQNTAYAECFTNTSAQIRRRGRNATNYCRLATIGWVDLRGRNA